MVRFSCCQEEIDDSETLVCNGPSHELPRNFHSECMNAENIESSQDSQTPWLCYDCNPPASPTQGTASSPSVSRTQSTSSDVDGWQVVEGFASHGLQEDEYFGTKTDVLKLTTQWAPTNNQVQPDTSEPFFLVEVAKAEKKYFAGWLHFPGSVRDDADDLAGNPFFGNLLKG